MPPATSASQRRQGSKSPGLLIVEFQHRLCFRGWGKSAHRSSVLLAISNVIAHNFICHRICAFRSTLRDLRLDGGPRCWKMDYRLCQALEDTSRSFRLKLLHPDVRNASVVISESIFNVFEFPHCSTFQSLAFFKSTGYFFTLIIEGELFRRNIL